MQKYTVSASFTLTNAGGDTDLLEILPASNYPLRLSGFILSQSSEIAEAQEEDIRIEIIRMTATVTSGAAGSSPNIEKVDDRAADPQFAAEVNNTTVATTSGATDILEEFAWNVRAAPLERQYPEEKDKYTFRNGQALLIRLPVAVADDMTFQITAFIEEF